MLEGDGTIARKWRSIADDGVQSALCAPRGGPVSSPAVDLLLRRRMRRVKVLGQARAGEGRTRSRSILPDSEHPWPRDFTRTWSAVGRLDRSFDRRGRCSRRIVGNPPPLPVDGLSVDRLRLDCSLRASLRS